MHTPEQLKIMAAIVLAAEAENDDRAFLLYTIVAQRTGLTVTETRNQIEGLLHD